MAIAIGGKMYDDNQMFDAQIDSVVGPVRLNAAQMAAMYAKSTQYSRGNTTQAGMLQGFTPAGEPPRQEAPAAAAPAPAQQRAPAKSALTAPPQPNLPNVTDPITQKERDEVSKPAKGLENTIKTSPTLLREKRRKSYLTAGG